jgi:predicted membrane chloride channel (bestrophin family)
VCHFQTFTTTTTTTTTARHVTIFGWSLKAHLRESTNEDIIKAMLPNPQDAAFVANYPRKPPAAIIMRLRQIFEYLAVQEDSVDKEVHKLLLQTTSRLNEVLMISERIRNSPIPPLYTAHTTRLLVFYLFWLPLALYDGTSILLGKTISTVTSTLLVTLAAGYAMLGLDEISHILELPFKLMPLRELSKMSMIDSADAMVYRPPPLVVESNDDDVQDENEEGASHVPPSTQIAW